MELPAGSVEDLGQRWNDLLFAHWPIAVDEEMTRLPSSRAGGRHLRRRSVGGRGAVLDGTRCGPGQWASTAFTGSGHEPRFVS